MLTTVPTLENTEYLKEQHALEVLRTANLLPKELLGSLLPETANIVNIYIAKVEPVPRDLLEPLYAWVKHREDLPAEWKSIFATHPDIVLDKGLLEIVDQIQRQLANNEFSDSANFLRDVLNRDLPF